MLPFTLFYTFLRIFHFPWGVIPQVLLWLGCLFVPDSISPQYLVLMLIVYIFECASCITSYTHRDYVSRAEARGGAWLPGGVCWGSQAKGGGWLLFPLNPLDPTLPGPPQMVSNPSLITKQMLTFYSADTDQGQELTRLWDRIMIEVSEDGQWWQGGLEDLRLWLQRQIGLPLCPGYIIYTYLVLGREAFRHCHFSDD